MQYEKKQVKLDNSLSFWKHFENQERFMFYNPLKDELILGAKRIKTLSEEESAKDCFFTFSSRTFFNTVKDEKWTGFGNETIAFEYYLVEKDGQQTLYYAKDLIDLENIEIQNIKHSFKYVEDDYANWEQLFSGVNDAILQKKVSKVVISREVKIECDTQVNVESVLQNLMEKNENSFVFAYFKDGKTFLGATPEILVQKEKGNILSYALAGTILRSNEDDNVQKKLLMEDPKNNHEHQIVADSIVNTMKKFTNEVKVDETKILTLKNIHHLQTLIHAIDKNSTLLDWVTRLHPTPALGGKPADKALDLIRSYEKHERGLFAAPIGIMDENGDGVFVVGIRSALIKENIVYAYAGCGIVEKSECKNEYIETRNKLRTIIESL